MLRLIICWLLSSGPVFASDIPFDHVPGFDIKGPAIASGALVWVPGTYGKDQTGPPPPPDFVGREAAMEMDIWEFNRDRGDDPLDRGAEILAHGIRDLREGGYRHVIAAGHSRGAWIALTVLAHPGLVDAVVAFSPAAHGTRDERKAQAMADWIALWEAAINNGTRVVLVQFADDPYDPNPGRRLAVACDRFGSDLLPIFRPAEPRGHIGVYEPAFDQQFGALVTQFAARNASLVPAEPCSK
jgi:pimeloyl-ACP methyl ester carboxylesterase